LHAQTCRVQLLCLVVDEAWVSATWKTDVVVAHEVSGSCVVDFCPVLAGMASGVWLGSETSYAVESETLVLAVLAVHGCDFSPFVVQNCARAIVLSIVSAECLVVDYVFWVILSWKTRHASTAYRVKWTAYEADAKLVYSANLPTVSGDGLTTEVCRNPQAVSRGVALVRDQGVAEESAPFLRADAWNLHGGLVISSVPGCDSYVASIVYASSSVMESGCGGVWRVV
jgi:hypothetical protein